MKKIVIASSFVLVLVVLAIAGEPSIWSVNTKADIMKGDARGVSIEQDGTVSLAPNLTEVFKTGEAFIWSSVIDNAGNVFLGTGGDGKIFKVTPNGNGSLFADLAEMNVTALAISRTGDIYAGTSPDGKVYRIDANGAAATFFEPKEKYIWSLAVMADGSIAIGTGDAGKIYRVRAANGLPAASLLFDTSETHIITLAADSNGNLFAGTDSNGLVMRFGADGKPFGILDSPLREIHEIAAAPNGTIYALALSESASAAKAESPTPVAAVSPKPVTVEKLNPTAPATPPKSRYDLTDAKSAVYRILSDGSSELIWSSPNIVGFSIYAHQTGNGVLIGTSDKGRIYDIRNDGRETLVLQTDANQISTIRSAGTSLIATSSNQGSLFRFGSETAAEGSYTSTVLDAMATATWGRIWWRSSGGVTIQTRSGNTEKADETWSEWSTALTDQKGAQVASPPARYLQWRAVLKGIPGSASLNEVSVAFLGRNIAPEVLSISVLPTNVGLASNPPVQIDPNIEMAGMDPLLFGLPTVAAPPRRVYMRGATSLQWNAEDRNGDKLEFDVFYKEIGDAEFKLLRGSLADMFLAIDGQSLADGRYLFKVVARDELSNPKPLALSGEKLTGPIDIDNTPPVITSIGSPQVNQNNARLVFEAVDASSYLTRAEYSVNGGPWKLVYAEDGISDSPRERYAVDINMPAAGEYAVTIRVYDVNGNSGNTRVTVRR